MIKIEQPAMSLNARELYPIAMSNTRIVYDDVTPFWLVNNIVSIAASTPEGKPLTLVVNAHSWVTEKHVFLGIKLGTGIYSEDIGKHFGKLKPMINKIILQCCAAARDEPGRQFCKKLARTTGAFVYAADIDQSYTLQDITGLWEYPNHIDDFEGNVFEFNNSGAMRPFQFERVKR